MNQQITRPILWNVPAAFVVIMYGLLVVWLAATAWAIFRWYRVVRLGTADNRFDRPLYRAMSALRDAFGQGVVVRESWGWMHYSFYVAFVGLFIGTTIVLINSDLRELLALFGIPLYFYYGDFYLVFKAAMDTFFLMLILAVLAEGARRQFRTPSTRVQPPQPKMLDNLENRLGYAFPMMMMVLVALTGLMLEGARINAQHPDFTEWAYVGRVMGRIEGALGAGATYHRFLWIVHVLLVYRSAVLLPVHQAASFLRRAGQPVFPQSGAAWAARADQGLRERRDLRRGAGRAIHLEADARHGRVPGVRALHDQLPHREHRQGAESQVPGDRTARASAR